MLITSRQAEKRGVKARGGGGGGGGGKKSSASRRGRMGRGGGQGEGGGGARPRNWFFIVPRLKTRSRDPKTHAALTVLLWNRRTLSLAEQNKAAAGKDPSPCNLTTESRRLQHAAPQLGRRLIGPIS